MSNEKEWILCSIVSWVDVCECVRLAMLLFQMRHNQSTKIAMQWQSEWCYKPKCIKNTVETSSAQRKTHNHPNGIHTDSHSCGHIRHTYFVVMLHTRTLTHAALTHSQIDSIITNVTFFRPFSLAPFFSYAFRSLHLIWYVWCCCCHCHRTRTTADADADAAASIWFRRYFTSFYVFLVHRIGIFAVAWSL